MSGKFFFFFKINKQVYRKAIRMASDQKQWHVVWPSITSFAISTNFANHASLIQIGDSTDLSHRSLVQRAWPTNGKIGCGFEQSKAYFKTSNFSCAGPNANEQKL